jgi:hypothetical protein
VSPVKYELGFYIPEDGILHNYSRGRLRSSSFTAFTDGWVHLQDVIGLLTEFRIA